MSSDELPPLRDVIAQHDLRAHKKLGQNFLLDANVTDKITRHAGDLDGAHVIEIGPGPGGLTRSLLKTGAVDVTALEFDPRAVGALQSLVDHARGRLSVVQGDALDTDITALTPAPRAIVANLPYNIATRLLTGWLAQIRKDAGAYRSMTLMFQKEVADRITATAGGKAYGRLSVLCQWLCDVKIVYVLPPSAFTPPPKVSSAVVHFVPKILPPDAPEFAAVEALTAAAFGQRRKMIRSTLRAYESILAEMGINTARRAEDLPPDVFIEIALRGAAINVPVKAPV